MKSKTPKGNREPFSTYVDTELLERVRLLVLRLSVERGRRVSIADVTGEALADYLKKHKG